MADTMDIAAPARICTLRIELRDTEPPIWREVEVATDITLAMLHRVIQAAMGWDDQHLWEFRLGGELFTAPGASYAAFGFGDRPKQRAASRVKLEDILRPRRTRFTYVYDMGDNWEHLLLATAIRPPEAGASYPRLTVGEGAAPPEDCGGIPGYYDLLAALEDETDPRHDEASEWFGGQAPDAFDLLPYRLAVDRIAKRVSAARAGKSKAPMASART